MIVAAISALAGVATVSAVDSAVPRMDRSKLLIGTYCFREAAHDEAHVRDLKECGIDFVTGVPAKSRATLDLLAKYGIGSIANGVLSGWWGGDGSNAGKMRMSRPKGRYEAQMAEYVASLDHPAIWMIDLCDEPSALDMQYLGEICDLIAARAPKTPAYLNLYPNYASVSKNTGKETRNQLGTTTYREHIDVYCRTVPLDYLSYDFYVYTPNRTRRPSLYRQMYDNFNIVADACRRTGRSFWYIPQVNSHNAKDFEPTTRNRLRFQAYTSMAFGAEVVNWACWMPGWWTNNVLTASGEKTAQYDRLKTVNAELHRLGPIYMRYRSTATHYVGFAATNGLETLGVPLLDVLDTASFRSLHTLESTPLVVGEMTPRGKDDGTRALFVVASGDPFDYAPAVRTLFFRVPQERGVEAFGPNGPEKLIREVDGSYTLRIAENSAVMLINRPKKVGESAPSCKVPVPARRRTAADAGAGRVVNMASLNKIEPYEIAVTTGTLRLVGAAGKLTAPLPQVKMITKEKEPVMVTCPRGTGLLRVAAGATVVVDADDGKESPPLAFAGAGTVVKKGGGTLVLGPGACAPAVSKFDLQEGSVLVRGGRVPVFAELRAGESWSVDVWPTFSAKTPEEMAASGIRVCKKSCAGMTISKTGEGELAANGIAGNVRRLVVSEGTLRIVPRRGGSDVPPGANLIANPGFENRGATWRKYVRDDGVTYATQFSGPGFSYATDSWAFGYSMIDGLFCARLHNNGGVATTVDFPAPGRYRLTLHMRSRADQPANPMLAFVKLKDGRELEVCRFRPPFTQNFIEYSYVFDMPEAGPHELVITGLGVPSTALDDKGRVRLDISTMVDGVALVREDVKPSVTATPVKVFPKDMDMTVAAGACLALDVPGTHSVASLTLGGQRVYGLVSASTHPAFLSGVGVLDVKPYKMPRPVKMSRDQ